MALIPSTLLFNSKKYGVGGITFDLLLSENHEMRSVVTTHTIEDGSVVADHIRNELRTGTVTGMVSNYSISTGLLEGAINPLAAEVKNRAKDAYEAFRNLWNAREPVTIVTQLEVYENVVVTSIRTEKAPETGAALRFSVSFQQIQTVKLRETVLEAGISIEDLSTTLNKQAAPKINAGRQVGEDLSVLKGQDFELQVLLGGI